METLILTKENKNKTSHRLNLGFLSKLKNSVVVEAFNKKTGWKMDIKDILDKYEVPDVVMIHAHNNLAVDVLKQFPSSCLKVIIAVDSYKIQKNDEWDFYRNFDLVILRHSINDNKTPVTNYWLPFSASEEEFYPDKIEAKKNSVSFVGTTGKEKYWQRAEAIRNLGDLVVNYGKNIKEYSNILRSHTMCLNSAEINSPFGKVFEIMMSGSIVVTPRFNGMNDLKGFSKDMFCLYKEDCSDINLNVREWLNDMDRIKENSKKSYDAVYKYHTDTVRIKELYNILKEEL